MISYIWKAHNEKVLNGKEVSPVDTLQLPLLEASSWKIAQKVEAEGEKEITPIS